MHRRIVEPQDRRTFLKTLATAGGVAVAGIPRRAAAQTGKLVNVRIGTTLAPEHPATQALNRWGDLLAKKTGGAFKVQVHPGAFLRNGENRPEGVAIGTVEAFWADPSEYASFNQALNIVSAPFIWNDRKQLQKAVRDPSDLRSIIRTGNQEGVPGARSGVHRDATPDDQEHAGEEARGPQRAQDPCPEIRCTGTWSGAWAPRPRPFPCPKSSRHCRAGSWRAGESISPDPLATILRGAEVPRADGPHQPDGVDHLQRATVPATVEGASEGPGRVRPGSHGLVLEFLTAQEGKMLEQLKGYGMTVVEPDQTAFRDAMKPLYEKYDNVWTRDLREKIQSYK